MGCSADEHVPSVLDASRTCYVTDPYLMISYLATPEFWREYQVCVDMASLATHLIDTRWVERDRW